MKTEFNNGSISIRPYRIEDIPVLFEGAHESIREIHPWMQWCHPNYSIADTTKFVETRQSDWDKGTAYSFGVFDLNSGRFLGGVGINFINPIHQFANLGYWVRSSETKRGIATTAVRLAARFGFDELCLRRLEIVVAMGNKGSERVAQKIGATSEGIMRNRLILHGRIHPAFMFSLVPEDLVERDA